MDAIRVRNLKKYYGRTKAVDEISFEVKKGEIFGFLGPNGAGKTTTIRCMMDFLRPDEGSISILGKDAQNDSTELKRDIGFLSGDVRLCNNWLGQDHLNLVKDLRGSATFDQDLINQFDFNPAKKFKNLSSGNRQKLGLILALMHRPKVLILDEPTLGLDPLLQHTIYEIFKAEAEKGNTIFMSSHNLAEVDRICGRVCIIKEGKIVAIESILGLKKKKIYTVSVFFEEGVYKKDELISEGIEVIKELEDGLILTVRGDIDPLLSKLAKFKLKDLEITHASLEEVFMEYYR